MSLRKTRVGWNPGLVIVWKDSEMGTSVQITPLCGVYSENPLSYLVSIDGFNILMDCGWNDLFDVNLLQPLSRFSFYLPFPYLFRNTYKNMFHNPYDWSLNLIFCGFCYAWIWMTNVMWSMWWCNSHLWDGWTSPHSSQWIMEKP